MLIGGGGHCKSVLDSALRMNIFEDIVITDPDLKPGTRIMGCMVVGTDDCLEDLREKGYDEAFISVGNVNLNPLREILANKVSRLGYTFPTIIDPSAIIADTTIIEDGTFIGKRTTINAGVKIGSHSIINTGSIIEHDCSVGDYTHVSVGAVLCGEVIIGNNCMIGAHSTIIQCRKVGDNSVVGAGAVVNKDVENDSTVVGVPAKKLIQHER